MLNEKVPHCRQSCFMYYLLGHVCFLLLINVCILFPDLFPKLLLQKSILPSVDTITHVKAHLESEVAKWL